jgi:O-antigen ligase
MRQDAQPALDRFLLQVVDGGLAGVIFLVPLVMGGRHPWGQLTLAIIAAMMGLAWAGHLGCCGNASWRPTRAAPLWLAGAALLLLQSVPLPALALRWFAPHNAELLPLWNSTGASGAGLGVWHYLSMTPADTRAGLAVFLAYGLVFFVAAERIRAVEDVERLLRWCALSAIGMAIFGLVQFFGGNGKFFWFYEHPQSDTLEAVKGSFANRNHFAHFLALGVGPLIWWLQDAMRRTRTPAGGMAWSAAIGPRTIGTTNHSPEPQSRGIRPNRAASLTTDNLSNRELPPHLLSLSLGIVLFAGLLSLSRGGIASMLLATAISAAVCYWTASLRNKFMAVLAAGGILVGVALAVFGYDRVAPRLDSLSSGSLEELDGSRGRRSIWTATLKSIPNHLLLGAGAGSFVEVYPAYANVGIQEGIEFTHAENCYLQVALETGVVGLALVLSGIVLCGWWCCRGLARNVAPRLRLCTGAIAASLAASVAHGLVDFVWYVPACATVVAVLAACALRVRQLADGRAVAHRPLRLPKSVPAVAVVGLLLLGGWMVATLAGPALAAAHWNEYRLTLNALEAESRAAERAGHCEPPDGNLPSSETEQKLIAALEQVVYWQPTHARAHLELADSHLRQFDRLQATGANPMSLVNIRDAVLQSHFPSQQAMLAWLSRAVGHHWTHLEQALRHTRLSLALCPLHGRGYVYLAELCFLDPAPQPSRPAYVAQALRVRPFDGAVLYGAGSEAYLAGDSAKWLDYAKRAFHSARRQQRQLMADLIGQTTPANAPTLVDFIVHEFQPDLAGLRALHAIAARRCTPEQLTPLVRYRAARAELEAPTLGTCEAASVWLEAQQLHSQLHNDVQALQCARNAVQCDPGNLAAHWQLALGLLKQQLFAEAEPQLRWCLRRSPGNPAVESSLREALKGQLDDHRRAAAENDHTVAR